MRFQLLTFLITGRLGCDTEIIVIRELVTVKHLRPGKAVTEQVLLTACLDGRAQAAAGPDGPVQADGGEERAEKELGVGVTAHPL